MTLRFPENPECIPQAAHSIRELIEKLPIHIGIVYKQPGHLNDKIRQLHARYRRDVRIDLSEAGNNKADASSTGRLPAFLDDLDSFFVWFEEQFRTRNEQYRKLLHTLNGDGIPLPAILIEGKVKAIDELKDFFQKASHHRGTLPSVAEFANKLELVEEFLIEQFEPRTFDDFKEIDDLLDSGL